MRSAVAAMVVAGAFLVVGAAYALTPNDPLATHPAYAALNLPEAWETSTGAPHVVIAIVDSGVDATHPDLAGAVLAGYDFVDDDEDAADPPGSGHGTAVAGAAAARAGNGIGGAGPCSRCSLLPLRVLGPGGIAAMADVARAIDFAVDRGAAVVNVSLYGESPSQSVRDAIRRARAGGVLVVAAAGNEASEVEQYPAAFPETISVGSATYDGRRASYSSHGAWVGYAGPECAPVTVLGGASGVGCMTSTSSPLVAGVVALMRAHDPYASVAEVEEALTRASRVRPVAGFRAGLVDAAAALRELRRGSPVLRPTIFGDPVAGRELEAFTGIWSGAKLPVTYQWERCSRGACSSIPGATRSRYVPTSADGGFRLRVTVATTGAGAASAQTRAVAVAPRPLVRPTVSGRARVGTRLRVSVGRWQGTNLRFAVNWHRCTPLCEPIGASRSYVVRRADRGARLLAEVVASNVVATATARSRATGVVR